MRFRKDRSWITGHSERANVGGNAQAGILAAALIAPDSWRKNPFSPANAREVALGEINPEGGAAPLDNNSYHDETVMNAKGVSRQ